MPGLPVENLAKRKRVCRVCRMWRVYPLYPDAASKREAVDGLGHAPSFAVEPSRLATASATCTCSSP